jgi:holo-[acyl-carrier protein] synthase
MSAAPRDEGHGKRAGQPGLPLGAQVLGLGIDVVEAARIGRLLERLPRAYERLFSEHERTYCDRFSDRYLHYAARFAAKEAVGKALGIGIIGFVWRDIEVLSGGKPRIQMHGDVALVAARLGVTRVELSLSHTAGMAYAVAAALKEDVDV